MTAPVYEQARSFFVHLKDGFKTEKTVNVEGASFVQQLFVEVPGNFAALSGDLGGGADIEAV